MSVSCYVSYGESMLVYEYECVCDYDDVTAECRVL
jgi:hypothetical protein